MATFRNLGGKSTSSWRCFVVPTYQKEVFAIHHMLETALFQIQTDWNYHVVLQYIFSALNLKSVSGRGYATNNTKEVEQEHEDESKEAAAKRQRRRKKVVQFVLFVHVNNIMRSMFSNVEVYINSQQIYNSNKDCMRTNLTCATFPRQPSLKIREFCTARGTNSRFFHDTMEALLSQTSFMKRMKTFSRLDGLMFYGNIELQFFSTADLLYPKREVRVRLIRARSNIYMVTDIPNVHLGIVDCSLYTPRFASKDDYQQKRSDVLAHIPVEFKYPEFLAKPSSFLPD